MNADHRLLERAFTESQRLAADANIAAVGYGTKLRDGRPSGGTCLQYFVRRKLPPGELERATTWPVPAAVDGLPTDVVEVGELRAAISNVAPPMGTRGTRMGDPLIGGYASVGLGDSAGSAGGFGTLGGLCFDSSTGAPLALSAAHTWGTTGKPEVMQPLLPRTLFGTNAEPLTNPSGLVRADVPIGLRAAVAFANAGVWARFVTGLGDDPVVFGQTSTPVAANARTDAETVSIAAEASPGLPPAGRTFTESIAWSYQRLSASALDAAVNQDRTNDKILSVRRASTDLASYTTSKAVKITAEIFGPAGAADSADNHFVVAHIYSVQTGDSVVRRLLRPVAGQAPPAAGAGFLYSGVVSAADLGKGHWAVSVFVQDLATGTTESANVTAGAAGGAVLVPDCTFDVV